MSDGLIHIYFKFKAIVCNTAQEFQLPGVGGTMKIPIKINVRLKTVKEEMEKTSC